MSTLERDRKADLAQAGRTVRSDEDPPATLLTLAYSGDSEQKADHLLMLVRQELKELAVDDSGQK